jgi:DNA-binding transcriptional LysR family regulator
MSRIELHRLRYFVVLAQELHFRSAAEKLHIAQPPLTKQIKKLEQDLGVELFHRTKRHVELTPAGQAFLVQAKSILAQVDQAADVARRVGRGEVGQLEIGYASSADLQVLPRVVPVFRSRFPGVRLRFRSIFLSDQVSALRNQQIDLGLVRLPGIIADDLIFESIITEALMVALPSDHRLAKGASVSLRQLAHERYIIFPRHFAPGLYDTITSAFQALGKSLNIVEEADHIQLNLSLIAMGDGLSLLPESLRCLRREGVTYLPLRPERLDTELGMVYRRDDDSPALTNFIEVARSLFVQSAPAGSRRQSCKRART